MAKNLLILALAIVIVVLGVILAIQLMPRSLNLPADAVKLSDCVPNMGAHYANPANMPFGPIYLVDKGKVVGIEFMMHENDLEKNILSIGGEKIGKPAVMPTLGMTFNHIELNYEPEGHEGDKEPHYDLHMYLISSEEQKKLCQ